MLIDLPITLSTPIAQSTRVQQLRGLFDLPPAAHSEQHWRHRFTLPKTWNIGVIVGPSGCGKTTLARRAFGDQLRDSFPWPQDKSILDGFPATMGIREITGLLCSVGFSSPPAWLRPFHALSTGEQFRVTVARTLAESPFRSPSETPSPCTQGEGRGGGSSNVQTDSPEFSNISLLDEFTSTVDRTAARIGSSAVAKAVRQRNQKFIAITCHYDILDWLQPDWIYEPASGEYTVQEFKGSKVQGPDDAPAISSATLNPSTLEPLNSPDGPSRRVLRRRPHIDLEITRVPPSHWPLFRPHHYLSGKLHPTSRCYLATTSIDHEPPRPAAFVAALPFPHPIRPGWREHRCVCLPEFQGVGIGNALSEFVAALFVSTGKPYFSTTSHPAMIRHRARSPLWKLRRKPSFTTQHRGLGHECAGAGTRLTAAFEFVGA